MLVKLLPGYFRPKPTSSPLKGVFQYLFEVRKDSATYQIIDTRLGELRQLYLCTRLAGDDPNCLFFVDRNEKTIGNIKKVFAGWAEINSPQAHFILAEFKHHYMGEVHMYMKQSASRLFPAEVHQYRRRIDRRYILADYVDFLKANSES